MVVELSIAVCQNLQPKTDKYTHLKFSEVCASNVASPIKVSFLIACRSRMFSANDRKWIEWGRMAAGRKKEVVEQITWNNANQTCFLPSKTSETPWKRMALKNRCVFCIHTSINRYNYSICICICILKCCEHAWCILFDDFLDSNTKSKFDKAQEFWISFG